MISWSNTKYIYYILIYNLFFVSCNKGDSVPNFSKIEVSLKAYRFDVDLYSVDSNNIGAGLRKLLTKYPDFLNYYLDTLHEYGINGIYSDTTKGIREGFRIELTFRDYIDLEDTIKKYYDQISDINIQLENGFKRVKYYFPKYYVPRIMYLNLGLSGWTTFPVDSTTLCIALDMFLGDNFPHYRAFPNIPNYLNTHRRKSYLPVSVFRTVYKTINPFQFEDKTLLDLMIQRGKEYYFLHKILPYAPDSVIFGFTKIQIDWCKENEALIYNYFIHERLLYSSEMLSISPYINEGPFAKGLESPSDPIKYTPGNIGSWLGYRIVCAWMKQNPGISISSLINQDIDANNVLDQAKYRPK